MNRLKYSITTLLLLISIVVFAANEYTDENGTIWSFTVSGSEAALTGVSGQIPIDLIIPSKIKTETEDFVVTSVGAKAFYNQSTIRSIVIPSGVTSIGNYAFSYCSSLATISIPESVSSIGESAFSHCTNLASVNIPQDVFTINQYTFSDCTNIETLVIPGRVSEIKDYAFNGSHIKRLVLEEGTNSLWCGLSNRSYYIENGEKIWRYKPLFANASVDTLYLGRRFFERMTSTQQYMLPFKDCKSLRCVELAESLSSIAENTFSGCPVSTVVSHMKEPIVIPSSAFTTIYTLHIPYGTLNAYRNTNYWRNIPLSRIILDIENGITFSVDMPYSNDTVSTSFTIIDSDSLYVELGGNGMTAFASDISGCLELPLYVTGEDEKTFKVKGFASGSCGSLSITKLIIPEGLEYINENACEHCLELKNISFPKSVSKIENAFIDCENIDTINVFWRHPDKISVGLDNFDGISSNGVLCVPAGTKELYSVHELWGKFPNIIENSPIFTRDVTIKTGGTVKLPVCLRNENEIFGVQFKISLPMGVRISEDFSGLTTSTTERSQGWTIMGHKDPDADNSYLFVAFSMDGSSLSGNEGAIMNVPLNVDSDMKTGDYPVNIENVQMTTLSFETLAPSDATSDMAIRNYALGDINDDGYIDVADLTAAVKFILGNASSNLLFKAADVDESGIVEINDYSAVVNMVLAQEDGPQFMGTKRLYTNTDPSLCLFTPDTTFVKHDGEGEALISLLEDSNIYTGLQFDLSLPEGLDFASDGVSAISKKHDVILTKKSNGDYRVVCTSDNNSVLCGDSTILRLRLKNVGAMTGIHEMTMYNVVLSDTNAVRHEAEAQVLHIMVGDEVTGLPEIEGDLDISVEQGTLTLKAHCRQTVTIVTMSGLVIDTFEMNDGETKTLKIGTGIFVVNDKKIINI